MNILFINPPNTPFSSQGILIEPIDLLMLASYIENRYHKNIKVSLLDMDIDQINPPDILHFIQNIDMAVIAYDYHIPLHDQAVEHNIKKIFLELKKKNIFCILGGKYATFYQDKSLGADVYLSNDMEDGLVDIIDKKFNIISSDFFSMKNNQFCNRNLIDINKYIDVRTMLTSRGCNLKCTFCHVPNFWGKWKARNAQNVVEEIENLVHHDTKKVLFLDDNATAQPYRMKEISQLLISQNIRTTLGCLSTIISYHQNVFEKMFESGFRWIHYGVESSDDKTLQNIGKKVNFKQIQHVVKETRQIGYRVRTSWIMDLPHMNENTLLENEKTIIDIDSEEIRLHFLSLRLGSQLQNEYQSDYFNNQVQYIHKSKPNFNLSGLKESQIQNSVHRIIKALQDKGYSVVTHPDQFIEIELLRKHGHPLKIVSLCPLRYGIDWNL